MNKNTPVSYQETTPNYITGMLDAANQEAIMLTVIAHKQYDRLLPMVNSGYKVSIRVLETLKWCGKENFIRRFLDNGFEFFGDYKHLLNFLNVFLGPKNAAVYIMENNLRMVDENCNSCWCRTAKLLTPQQLAENGYWDELVRRYNWEILAQYGQADLIINSGQYQSPSAVSILKRYNLTERIIELKKFEWLTKIVGGEKLLYQHKQFELLYRFRTQLTNWTEKETLKELCRCPEGRKLLYHHKEYGTLIKNDCTTFFVQDRLWETLAHFGRYDLIDWELWYQEEKEKADTQVRFHDMNDFYPHAAAAGEWKYLLRDKQRKLLFKHHKFNLWRQTFTASENSEEKERQPLFAQLQEKFSRKFRPCEDDEDLD